MHAQFGLIRLLDHDFADDILRDGGLRRKAAFIIDDSCQYLDQGSGSAVGNVVFDIHDEVRSEAIVLKR